ncbi:MAG: FHA domain-containing protein [Leptolyngbyaceae bacterium]|nr:FHA domain-containing protein [Leptolyngbyaceae bacterium]
MSWKTGKPKPVAPPQFPLPLIFCGVTVITLTLLHPLKNIPVQSWTFENETLIRVGRSTDNQVVLYSAVVSRNHVELRLNGIHWEVVNLGTNGTYIDGKRINQVPLVDGMVIRLARSGPNIQIHVGSESVKSVLALLEEDTVAQKAASKPTELQTPEESKAQPYVLPVPPHLQLSPDGEKNAEMDVHETMISTTDFVADEE